jgi:acyl carrier protein
MPFDPPPDPVLPRVLEIVAAIAGPNRRPPDPGARTRLAAGGFWLDSIDLLELMLACDEAFGGVFDGASGSAMAHVETVGDLVTLIEERARG